MRNRSASYGFSEKEMMGRTQCGKRARRGGHAKPVWRWRKQTLHVCGGGGVNQRLAYYFALPREGHLHKEGEFLAREIRAHTSTRKQHRKKI
jgi:hypothetical protein